MALAPSRAPQGTDVQPIHRDDLTRTGQPRNHQAVANYIAKYATKTLTVPGVPAQRLRHQVDIEHLRCSAHYTYETIWMQTIGTVLVAIE